MISGWLDNISTCDKPSVRLKNEVLNVIDLILSLFLSAVITSVVVYSFSQELILQDDYWIILLNGCLNGKGHNLVVH